jgi:DNA-binding transcriptional MerR regulator
MVASSMPTITSTSLRIGELAALTGTTPRTIRYYEEIGLLARGDRPKGKHRLYRESDVRRLVELTRLRDLLGLSLEELRRLLEAEEARDELRRAWRQSPVAQERLRIVDEALRHLSRQLRLVRRRRRQLERLEADLSESRRVALARRRELRS